MITFKNNFFHLQTHSTSTLLSILPTGQIEHLHYGAAIQVDDITSFQSRLTGGYGACVSYGSGDWKFSLDSIPLAFSGSGKGDFRHSPLEIVMPDGTWVTDFIYNSHEILSGTAKPAALPSAYDDTAQAQTLKLTLKDTLFEVYLDLYWTVFPKTDVIARRAVVRNESGSDIIIRKLMSFMLDMHYRPSDLITLDGAWIKETHAHRRPLSAGMHVNDSTTGASSNRHNTGFIVCERDAREDWGECFAFNLAYSGNHYSACEISGHGMLRIMEGLSPHQFEWPLASGSAFESPEAFMTWSDKGLNGVSAHCHDFINDHIVRGVWKGKERPVVMNNWEATFFDFTESKIVRMAREARDLGAELFVLDDGWFGDRNNDRAGLGDYRVNRKKLPGGLTCLADKINAMGMKFGLWFEPEMVNEDSDLYRAHPEYAVRIPGREPSRGRNQLVLNLTLKAVRDYIVENVCSILVSASISYVKWDMNRSITDMFSASLPRQGMFFHSYMLGLYEVLGRITAAHPGVLLESCSSGGNRFDPGMLCYSPQVWASDDTDPIERLKIQEGLSYLYPLSCIGAHVSASPHQQTLRKTGIATRCNVSAFGVLGFELDMGDFDGKEKEEIAKFIAFYKANRRMFQYGRFFRFNRDKENVREFEVARLAPGGFADKAVYGFFVTQTEASPAFDRMRIKGLDPASLYVASTLPSSHDIRDFGGLVKHALPVKLKANGILLNEAGKHYRLPSCVERHTAYGSALMSGILLNQRFSGLGYNDTIRLVTDFGSELYIIEKMDR